MKGVPVIQSWVIDLTLMQQTVVISAIRGCDGIGKGHPSKDLVRWFRRCVVLSAMDGEVLGHPAKEGGGSFTGPVEDINGAVEDFVLSRDSLPSHYMWHAIHAFEVLGYKHPEPWVREFWLQVYCRLVHCFHVWPETEEQMDKRLGDNEEGWKEREDQAGSCQT